MRQIILDTETTGLSPNEGHRIIEIGCVELINRQYTNNNFHFYINPERTIEAGAINVHGITNEFLVDKPLFGEVADDLYNYLKGAEVIAHNAPFDLGFLNYEFNLYNPDLNKLDKIATITDTLAIARKLHPGQRNSLDALCKRYSVDSSERDLHGALLDARILAEVYLAMTGGQGVFDLGLAESSRAKNKLDEQKFNNIDLVNLPEAYISPEDLALHNKIMGLLSSS